MKTIVLTEEKFKSFLRNAFIQGEKYQENWALEQIGEIDEVTEKDFGEWYNGLEWKQEQMYSEEDMLNFAWFLKENLGQFSCDRTAHFEGKYIEQFKKK